MRILRFLKSVCVLFISIFIFGSCNNANTKNNISKSGSVGLEYELIGEIFPQSIAFTEFMRLLDAEQITHIWIQDFDWIGYLVIDDNILKSWHTIGPSSNDILENNFSDVQILSTPLQENTNFYYELIGIGNCSDKNITIPESLDGKSVRIIGSKAFMNCDEIKSVVIPDSVASIGDSAFLDCNALTYIVIPEKLTLISEKAFWGCNDLCVYYMGTAEEWETIIIKSFNDTLINSKRFYYSEEKPNFNQNKFYWHYNSNGEIEVWDQ